MIATTTQIEETPSPGKVVTQEQAQNETKEHVQGLNLEPKSMHSRSHSRTRTIKVRGEHKERVFHQDSRVSRLKFSRNTAAPILPSPQHTVR
jgi:hypothetical protein